VYAERHRLTLVTDASGDAVAYTPHVLGRVLAVVYTKDGTTPFANGVDLTVTAEATAQAILALTDQNASGTFYPPWTGTRTVNEPVTVAGDRVKVVVAQGGDTKTGTVDVIVG
jgi:YD repeat-containing protein